MANKKSKKTKMFGNTRSKALNSSRRSQKVNFQTVTLPNGEKIVTSAREAKKYKKTEKEVKTEEKAA